MMPNHPGALTGLTDWIRLGDGSHPAKVAVGGVAGCLAVPLFAVVLADMDSADTGRTSCFRSTGLGSAWAGTPVLSITIWLGSFCRSRVGQRSQCRFGDRLRVRNQEGLRPQECAVDQLWRPVVKYRRCLAIRRSAAEGWQLLDYADAGRDNRMDVAVAGHSRVVTMNVVVGVDAHKKTHTLVAVNATGRKLAQKTVATTTEAHEAAVQWARVQFGDDDVVWGVEDCRTLTARLERDLLAAGQRVVRVPPHLMSRTRASSRERGKSDPIDALAVARAVQREPDLPVASHDPVSMELRLLVDRRDDLVAQRTATINRLIGRIHILDPLQPTPANWIVQKAHRELQEWLATQPGLVAELARDELDDIIRVGGQVKDLRRRIEQTVRPVASELIAMQGCAELTAAKIVAEVAGIDRFRSEAAFAAYIGLAPIPQTSGTATVRLRSTRRGNRHLNAAIHRIALTQTMHDGPGKTYFQRRLAEGDSRQRALRSLKRRLVRVVYNRLRRDAETVPERRAAQVSGHPSSGD